MKSIGPVRRGALAATGLAAGLLATLAGAATTGAAAQPALQPVLHAATPATAAAGQRTALAFLVDGCNRCHVRLYQAVQGRDHVWESKVHRVRDGRVSFDVATRHTHGLSASVRAPWEGNAGFVTQIAFRYGHEAVGSEVSNREARTKRRAAGCWAGTTDTAALLPLVVRKVTIPGADGSPTTAARAWISTTADWWQPMFRADKGILGAQDILPCERP